MIQTKLTSLDQLLIALLIAGPCQGGFFHEDDRSVMELRYDIKNPKTKYFSDIVDTKRNPNTEIYTSDNIKISIKQDTIMGCDLKIIADLEIFGHNCNIIIDNIQEDLLMANAIVKMIGVLSSTDDKEYDKVCDAYHVTWHFPHVNR